MTDHQTELHELQEFFKTAKPPTKQIQLNPCSTITNYSLFLEADFALCKMNVSNKGIEPYLERLRTLKTILEQENK